ncbi:MAG: DUF3316 domain-containing protein [Tannerella sp.]|nr:DUF3316 domain-containing protein [Tannerella sp.]
MRNLNVTALMSCIYMLFFFSLNAQTLSEDSIISHRMSFEKADSLLTALSKEKSKKNGDPQNDTIAINPLPEDTLTRADSSADILTQAVFSADTSTRAAFSADTSVKIGPGAEDSAASILNVAKLAADSAATWPSIKNRKKANVARSGFLVEQEGEKIKLKNDDDVDYTDLRSINEGTLLGVGGYRMSDTYLSPEKYGGVGFRFMNERMRLTKLLEYKISRQNVVNVDISSTMNGAENANFLSGFVDYSVGYHYLFLPDPYFKIKVGGSIRSMFGMAYNTRNGNNPLTVHADIDLNFSLIAIYEFHIKKYPLTIRYQFETPFAGVLFSPVYNQSYYEIFSLGNTAEVFNFNSFDNKFAMRNYCTLDFPVGGMTLRAGYFGTYYSTHIHRIDRYIISHNLMLGFVKEFVAFGGREMRKRNLFHSAYY